MRSRAASARRIRSTARSRSSIGGPSFASLGTRNAGMSASARPRVRRIWATSVGIPSGASPLDAPTDRGMIQRRCGTRLMTFKYRTWVCVLVALTAACSPETVAPSPSPIPTATTTATQSPTRGLPALIPARITADRRWYTMSDGLQQSTVMFSVVFDADPAAGQPFINVLKSAGGRPGADTAPLQRRSGNEWAASLPVGAGYAPGEQTARVVEFRTDPSANGGISAEVPRPTSFFLTHPNPVLCT